MSYPINYSKTHFLEFDETIKGLTDPDLKKRIINDFVLSCDIAEFMFRAGIMRGVILGLGLEDKS